MQLGAWRIVATSLAVILAPALAGWLAGAGIRRAFRTRIGGPVWPAAALTVALAAAVKLDASVALVGVWDAAITAMLFVAGVVSALHRVASDRGNLALCILVGGVTCVLMEPLGRVVLPPPPAFPETAPHLFLADATRESLHTLMSTTTSQVVACGAVYGEFAAREGGRDALRPFAPSFHPRADVRMHVLHLGDSILYGAPDRCFTDDLAVLEPDVEHINAAVPATAPDMHLALLRRWLAHQPIDAVVMHLNPNDLGELDRPFPCSAWESLMVYDNGVPRLRFSTEHPADPEQIRWRLLLQNSPPPYLFRAAVPFSVTAAHLAAALVYWDRRFAFVFDEDLTRAARHMKLILGAARDELRERHIPFVVDILHWQLPVQERKPDNVEIKAIVEQLGIVTLDSWEPLVAALDRGEQPFADSSGHFNPTGYAIMAKWLHADLPTALERARHTP